MPPKSRRFVKKDEKTGKWYDIGDKRAAEKTSQALREKTNEERDRPKTTPGFTSPTVFLPSPTSATLTAAAASASALIQAATSSGKAEKPEASATSQDNGGKEEATAKDSKATAKKDSSAKQAGKATQKKSSEKVAKGGVDKESADTTKKGSKKSDGEEKKTEDKKNVMEV